MAATLTSITINVDAETQDLLTKAAALAGMPSLNSFVLNAAIEKARQVIEREQVLTLSRADAVLLMDALDNSTTVNAKLKSAAERYENKTQ
ncbi:DUF1778 domain-containing protein [Venatoribacter cucullus]|uniref:DUF1778 domain-containing protein n=1 Tax=Venatoribacter cucullus TaxID=2661630 RepID=A0A9X7YPH6_9GAMM|nr:DUF1778 domain-containing protein [Venatoribacter cucullus]QQD21346.1 DUF1778 domain-containing protein [Oceanospirillaceae bacterium ASx5O]QQD24027.1 DUF1778 domain-containing protein [Venatoribacter cucullus]